MADPVEMNSYEAILNSGYIDTFRHLYPTRREYTNFSLRTGSARELNNGWRVDQFVITMEHIDLVVDKKMHKQVEGSDHVPIELVLDYKKVKKLGR